MQYVKRISELTKDKSLENGGKAANLGEMTQNGFNVPGGFCVTGKALDYLLDVKGLMPRIMDIVATLNFADYGDIEKKSKLIRNMITEAEIPADLEAELKQSIENIKTPEGQDQFVAVRSSVSVKDSVITSFPGMMDTYHFIKGEKEIMHYIKECWASLFTARALYRRNQQDIPQDKGVIAPIIQKMVNSDVAGVLFTANPITSSRNDIVIEANWGLGESLVSGEAIVDYFVLDRSVSPVTIKTKKIMKKNIIVTVDKEKGIGRKKYDLEGDMITDCTLTDEQLVELGELGLEIEKMFDYPQDIEWTYENGELFLLQTRNIKALKDI